MAAQQVKIVLITGYLGAGKTTLLNKILANNEGIRAAVIVNDIGEVNVDASLIKQGALTQTDELIPMTNGCICCTLADDLAKQLDGIANSGEFDYIVIEASGICEPIPIAYTISRFCDESNYKAGAPLALDNIVAVVDADRMFSEFDGGKDLLSDDIDEEDIEALLIQQLEFCTTVILNKADLVTPEQLAELKALVRGLQKDAVIVEATQCDVPMSEILDTGRFDFNTAYESAVWMDAMEHPEEHEDPEVLEYDITTFVYQRRRPFDIDAFADYVGTWPNEVIRTKGMLWAAQDPDMSYLFEQVGHQVRLMENGYFVASAPEDEMKKILAQEPELLNDWDPVLGDRMTKLVIIGRHMDRDALEAGLDACLSAWNPER